MLYSGDFWVLWLLCDCHDRRFGSRTQRADSCGFTDLWAYKYPVCGSSALPVSATCCPLSQAKKKNMSILGAVGGSEVDMCTSVDVGKTYSVQYIIFWSKL